MDSISFDSMSAPSFDTLAGALMAMPGPGDGGLRSTRRELAPRLARGQPANALPDLLAAVFTLCGGAHRLAARAAVAAAQGAVHPVSDADRALLCGDTLREHLRRIFLDWPRAMPWPGQAPEPALLAACPLWRDPLALQASRAWIEQHVLGEPADAWAQAWCRAPLDQAQRWANASATAPARWLKAAEPWLAGLWRSPRPLAVHLRPTDLSILARALARDTIDAAGRTNPGAGADTGAPSNARAAGHGRPGFVSAPLWQGQPAETGPWTRGVDVLARPAGHDFGPPFLRLAARVAEVALLLAPEGEQRLALTAQEITPGEGLACCEMARGLLVHWVRLAPGPQATAEGPRVAECRVLAPTDWNFHPRGAMARLLQELPVDAPQQQVLLLAAAFDPCVAVQVQRRDGTAVPVTHPSSRQEPSCTK
jgi:hypothetical protein